MASGKLIGDFDRYHRSFKAYARNSNRLQVTTNFIHTQLRQVMDSIKVNSGDVTRVLSIGPGDGEVEDEILKVIRDRNEFVHPVEATIVEPSVYMIEEHKNRVDTQGSQLRSISYDWRTETLKAYLENGVNDGVKFHFINAVHSVYYFQDLPGTLRDLYNRLEPGGMMLILVVTGTVGAAFAERYHQPDTTSQKVKASCVKENIPIAHESVIEERTDITDCFDPPEDMSEDGRLLLDFYTHVDNFTKTASPETQAEVLQFLKSDRFSDKKDGKTLLKGDWEYFIIVR
ncbi:histamine N-methyltransferase B-like [Asterias amurensis]|uniref:histamine N-methyltransferase B-like n=1 Tax=Asterias amurensis TaxID=7602 RepID=UPI003AB24885